MVIFGLVDTNNEVILGCANWSIEPEKHVSVLHRLFCLCFQHSPQVQLHHMIGSPSMMIVLGSVPRNWLHLPVLDMLVGTTDCEQPHMLIQSKVS